MLLTKILRRWGFSDSTCGLSVVTTPEGHISESALLSANHFPIEQLSPVHAPVLLSFCFPPPESRMPMGRPYVSTEWQAKLPSSLSVIYINEQAKLAHLCPYGDSATFRRPLASHIALFPLLSRTLRPSVDWWSIPTGPILAHNRCKITSTRMTLFLMP